MNKLVQVNRARLLNAWFLCCLTIYLGIGDLLAATQQPVDQVGFYIHAYGQLRPGDDPRVAKAHEIFEKVRSVADKNSGRLPRLTIVNSSGPPWAIALPDGHIVLSERALDVCDKLGDRSKACLAFVFGHELAHMADDDFWHNEVHSFLADRLPTQRFAAYQQQQHKIQARELAADGKGYVYAAMAGYPVDRLLSDIGAGEDFFSYWLRATRTRLPGGKKQTQLRRAVIAERLEDIRDKLRFFETGVRLSHFDHCDDALHFYEEFLKVFPGRAVLNNLGYCHLQIARQNMPPSTAYFYWMPLQLEGATRATALRTRDTATAPYLKGMLDQTAHEHLERAVEYLERAVQSDPGYVPSQVNLAVAYLYLGRPHQASAAIAEALRLDPQQLHARAMGALALYEQSGSGMDLWPHAERQLVALSTLSDTPVSVLFNLARLYEVRGRHDEAGSLWSRLLARVDELPSPIQEIACASIQREQPANCDDPWARPATAPLGRWPFELSGLTDLSAGALKRLEQWERNAFDWSGEDIQGTSYRSPDDTAKVLELDGYVQMQMISGDRLPDEPGLTAHCEQPLRYRQLPLGRIASCGDWAALLVDERVEELWWITR